MVPQNVRDQFSAFYFKKRNAKIHHFLMNSSLLFYNTFSSKNGSQMSPKSQKTHTGIQPFFHTLFLSEFAHFLIAF